MSFPKEWWAEHKDGDPIRLEIKGNNLAGCFYTVLLEGKPITHAIRSLKLEMSADDVNIVHLTLEASVDVDAELPLEIKATG